MSPGLHNPDLFCEREIHFYLIEATVSSHYSQPNPILVDIQTFHLLLTTWEILHTWALIATRPQLAAADKVALAEGTGSLECHPIIHCGSHMAVSRLMLPA